MERENEEASKRVIEVGKAISSPAELKASDYFYEIRYVPLETRMIVWSEVLLISSYWINIF